MKGKTKEQLLKEVESLRERLSQLENANLEQNKVIEALSGSEAKYNALLNADIMELGGCKPLLRIIKDITEHNRTEIALKAALVNAQEEKNKSEAIISALGDGIIIQDTDYKIIYQNQVQNEIYGDKTGEFCYEAYEGRDRICEDCPVERTFMDGNIHRSERKVATDKGDFYFELTSSPLRDSTGKIIAGIKVVRDITGSKRMEETLRKSEEKYRRLVETLMEGIWVLDKDGKTTFVNPRMAQMLGYTVDEMLGEHLFSFMDEKGIMNAKCYLERRQQCIKEQHDFEFLRKDGTRIYASLETSPITDENGNYSGAIAAIADITERKRDEIEKNRLLKAIASSKDGITICDEKDRYIYVNAAYARIFGYFQEDFIGETWRKITPSDMIPAVEKGLEDTLHNKDIGLFKGEVSGIKKDGGIVPTEVMATGLWDENRNYNGHICIVRDITDRKRDEEKLREGEQFLENIFSSIQDGIGVIDTDMNIIRVNETAQRWYPYAAPLVGKKCYEAYHNRKERCEKCPAWETLKTGKSAYKIVPKHGPEGKEVGWLEIYSYPLNDTTTGRMKGVIEYVRDITELKLAEEALRKSEEKFRGIFEQSPIAIELYDREGNLIDANRSCLTLFGINDIKSVIGFKLFEDPNIHEDKKKRLSNGESIEFESVFDFELVKKAHLYETTKSEKCYLNILIAPLITGERERYGYLVHVRDITERKRAEEELAKSRTMLIKAQEIGHVGSWEWNIATNELIWSKEVYNIYGLDPSMVEPKYDLVLDSMAPESKNDFMKAIDDALKLRKPFEMEYIIIRPDGSRGYAHTKGEVLFDNGHPITMYGMVQDITERKKVEKALHDSETRYRTLFEIAGDAIFILEAEGEEEGRIVEANQTASRIHGYSIEELQTMNINDLNTWESLNYARDFIKRILKGETIKAELDHCRKDGSVFPVEINAGLLELGGHKYILAFDRDITKRKRTEEGLRMSNIVVENSQTVLFRRKAQEDWPVEFVSNNVVQFGYKPEEFLSGALPYASIIHPHDIERVSKEVREHSDSGDDRFQQEYRIIARNGAVHWIYDRTVIERNRDGQLTHYQGIIIDITERKHTEEAIRKYNKELEESNRMKELFTDIMHHDLLNPLNVANGYVELFLEDETNTRKKSYLETVKRNLVKGMELIDNATKFSKLESMSCIEFEDVDLENVIREAVANLTPLVISAGMSIENKLKGSIPVKANKIIEDVFINIISNAIKYAPEGKKIVVQGKDRGKSWSVSVKDFGAGIKDSEKTLIFERFHREEKKGVKGSGLGLAIAGKIIELHKGKIWVEDNPEGGAVFVVEIPKR
jgi:PAS domain S-box-containing protein